MRIKKDIPITDESQDFFSRKPLVDVIVRAIREYSTDQSNCVTIGVYGPWGEGKTSVMNMVYSRLSQLKYKDKLTLVKYNPWLIKDQESLLIDFFKTIIGAGPSKKLNSFLKRYANLISYLAGQASEKIAPLSGNTISSLLGRIINGLPGSEQSIEECKRSISFQLKREERHLIVFIDDLDRLDAKEIHTVFRLIKQVADFDNVIYIVALDVNRVSEVIETKDDYGRNFLNKIIQIPISLPKLQRADLSRELKKALYEIIDEFGIESGKIDVENVAATIINLIKNNRDIIRYYNALLLSLPSVKDELNLNDFCIFEYLDVFDHRICDAIYEHRTSLLRLHTSDLYVPNSDKINERIEDRFKETINIIKNEFGQEVVEILRFLFPKRDSSYKTTYEVARINNSEYFDRFFIRNYQKGSISHSEITNLLLIVLNTNDGQVIANTINRWLDISDSYRTIEALENVIVGNDNNVSGRIERIKAIIPALFKSNIEQNTNSVYGLDLASKIVAWIQLYMFDTDDGDRRYHEEEINEVLRVIFKEAELDFCLSILPPLYRTFDFIIKRDVFDVLKARIIPDSEPSYNEIIKYRRISVQYFFIYWNNVNSNQLLSTMKMWINDKDFKTETFIRLFIDSDRHFVQDLELFVSLFEDLVEEFMEKLSQQIEPNSDNKYLTMLFRNWRVALLNYKTAK